MCNFKHLTNKKTKEILISKSKILHCVREYFYKNKFIEIHTPILAFSTKEYGGGEFLVISKLQPGRFYSLPHSPQLYKQILMATLPDQINKYYQIAFNFRPEKGDETHSQQFIQIDFELANTNIVELMKVTKKIIRTAFTSKGIRKIRFCKIKYEDALRTYGTNSPDLRVKKLTLRYKNNKCYLAIMKENITNKKKLLSFLEFKRFAIAQEKKAYVVSTNQAKYLELGKLRNELIFNSLIKKDKKWSFVFLTELPIFIEKNSSLLTFHHSQMAPKDKNIMRKKLKRLTRKELLKIKGDGYDLIINGLEVAGGNIRINNYHFQKQLLEIIGKTKKEINTVYKPLLILLKNFPNYQSGGAAIGLDRLIMLLSKEISIYNTQAFPINCKGRDFLGGPLTLLKKEQRDIGINVNIK